LGTQLNSIQLAPELAWQTSSQKKGELRQGYQ